MANTLNPSLMSEIGPDGVAREAPIIAYTEKIIEKEQLQLKRYIQENYSKIRDVEKELANLSLELKLTAGSKNAAFEHMRKKIEVQNEKVRAARLKEDQARKVYALRVVCGCVKRALFQYLKSKHIFVIKVWEAAVKVVEDEEAIKKKLCDDLNHLVQESSNSQYTRLEELKQRLEALNPARASVSMPPNTAPSSTISNASSASTTEEQLPENEVTAANVGVANGTNKQPGSEEKAKKKTMQGRGGKGGLGALSKGRNPLTPGGWTGSGFNVDS